MSRGYNEQSFREDLKVLYNRLGIENRHIAFMLSDQQVVEEGTRCSHINYELTSCRTCRLVAHSYKLIANRSLCDPDSIFYRAEMEEKELAKLRWQYPSPFYAFAHNRRRHHVFRQSGRPLTRISRDAISSVLRGRISMKLDTNIRHVSRHC